MSNENIPTLFEMLGGIETKGIDKLSYQADVYEAIPRFVWKTQTREYGKYLPILKRDFQHKGVDYQLELIPARIGDKEYYPGAKEELIEMELVKMAFEKGVPTFNGTYGIKFSLYEIRQRLSFKGHSYNIPKIKEALHIMSRCTLKVNLLSKGTKAFLEEPMISGLGMRTWDDWKELGKSSECFLKFNSLHVESLRRKTWRLYDLDKALSLTKSLPRWIYKRICRDWIRAKFNYEIKWKLSSIVRDYGMEYSSIRKARQSVEEALQELTKNRIFMNWEVFDEEKSGVRGTKISDVTYILKADISFISSMKRFNQLSNEAEPLMIPES